MRTWICAALCALAACGGAGRGNPPWRGGQHASRPSGPPREFTPVGASAVHYNDPAWGEPPSSPMHDAVAGAVADAAAAAGKPAPRPDARLYAACTDIAGFLGPDDLPGYQLIQFALAHHGVIEPSPQLILVLGDERAPESVAEALAEKLGPALATQDVSRLGVGTHRLDDGRTLVIVALLESHVETEPIARRADLGQSIAVRGRVLEPYGDPQVYVTGASGQVDKLKLVRDGGAGFRAEVRCQEHVGPRQVEIIGRGPAGVTVLANFPVYCGEDAPVALSVPAPDQDDQDWTDREDAEQIIFRHLNDDRRAAGLPALEWDDRAAAIARAHSDDMARNHFVAHVSPSSGNAADRAKRAGLNTPLVLENVARAYSPGEAQRGFMNSPGHRANVLSADATHIGIGVVVGETVQGQRELYVTQLFFRVPPKVDAAEARKQARAALAGVREDAGAGELRVDKDLDELAQWMAGEMARGGDQEDVQRRGDVKMDALANRFSAITTIVIALGAPEQLASDALLDGTAHFYGLGLAQGDHAELGPGTFYVVVLLARPR